MIHDMAEEKSKSRKAEKFLDSDDVGINEIHKRIVSREQVEPEEGFENPPWWVWALSVLVLFAMGYYLGRYSGSWGTVAHEVEQPLVMTGTVVPKEIKGDRIFAGVCQTCHQSSGSGIPGQYPPLEGSEWVINDKETPVRIVLYGLEGPVTVKGNHFANKMPHFHDRLSDGEIAAVLTHIRSSWGNNAPAVKPEDVAAVRKNLGVRSVWSSSELIELRTRK